MEHSGLRVNNKRKIKVIIYNIRSNNEKKKKQDRLIINYRRRNRRKGRNNSFNQTNEG